MIKASRQMKLIRTCKEFCLCLFNPDMMPTALKVSIVVGSILFLINNGSALVKGQMNRERWLWRWRNLPNSLYGEYSGSIRKSF
jgi:hypothetical protein